MGSMRSKTYREYLRSDVWKQRRGDALERAGHCCQVCNRSSRLDVHHRTYARLGWERPEDLTVLCRDCHELYHDAHRVAPEPEPEQEVSEPVVYVDPEYQAIMDEQRRKAAERMALVEPYERKLADLSEQMSTASSEDQLRLLVEWQEVLEEMKEKGVPRRPGFLRHRKEAA